jgi:hypothetical protein
LPKLASGNGELLCGTRRKRLRPEKSYGRGGLAALVTDGLVRFEILVG